MSDPGFAWLLTEHCPGKCQAESDVFHCCSLPRSIHSFHQCFGIDLRPNMVSVDRGLASWRVRLVVIWIKDHPSSTAPAKPWGRSVTLLNSETQLFKHIAVAKCMWLLIYYNVSRVICFGPKKFPFTFQDLLCSTSATDLLVLCKSNQTVGLIVMTKPLIYSYQHVLNIQ